MRRFLHPWLILAAAAVFFTVALGAVWAQRRGRNRGRGGGYGRRFDRQIYNLPPRDIFPSNTFTFCRVRYTSNGARWDWSTDYPDSDLNFPMRLSELTTIRVEKTADGEAKHVVVGLTEPDLLDYPFAYLLEALSMALTEPERAGLRQYLLRGGFLMVDDFWGDTAWENFAYEIGQVLPPEDYPIVDIPLTHEIFHSVFDIKEVPQVPAIEYYDAWRSYGITYEPDHDYRSAEATKPHLRGIFDPTGRLMVVIMHNSDLGDGWERERLNETYFRDFSVKKAYPLGINIVVYAMTH
jgi:hypothetical protein